MTDLARVEAFIAGYDVHDLVDLLQPPAWHADALCREYPHLSFFPGRGEDQGAAKAVCGRCAVRSECLAAALEDRYTNGVWGGTSERERRRLRRVSPMGDRAAA